jgi:hypothetical protein
MLGLVPTGSTKRQKGWRRRRLESDRSDGCTRARRSISLAVAGGFGEFEVPARFSYLARVAVQCESGSNIETRESRPVQVIKLEGDAPIHLILTIPGAACQLWRPK